MNNERMNDITCWESERQTLFAAVKLFCWWWLIDWLLLVVSRYFVRSFFLACWLTLSLLPPPPFFARLVIWEMEEKGNWVMTRFTSSQRCTSLPVKLERSSAISTKNYFAGLKQRFLPNSKFAEEFSEKIDQFASPLNENLGVRGQSASQSFLTIFSTAATRQAYRNRHSIIHRSMRYICHRQDIWSQQLLHKGERKESIWTHTVFNALWLTSLSEVYEHQHSPDNAWFQINNS